MASKQLLEVLSIAHDASFRGEGLSIRDALKRSRYDERRESIKIDEVISALKDNPELVLQWIMFSEDKRTNGGWYILSDKHEIGKIGDDSATFIFDGIEEAVAYYVLHELDFWASLNTS